MNLRASLVILALISLLTIGGGGFFLTTHLSDAAWNVARNHTNKTTEMVQQKVSFYLSRNQLSSQALAKTPAISGYFKQENRPSNAEINKLLNELCLSLEASICYLMDSSGTTVAASNYETARSLIGKNYGFRPYFKEAIAGKSATYLALGVTTKKRGFYFSAPVVDNLDEIKGVLVVKYPVEKLEGQLSNLAGTFALIDPKGVVFASNRKSWLFRSLSELSSEDASSIIQSRQFGEEKLSSVGLVKTSDGLLVAPDGTNYLFGSRTVDISAGWRVSYLFDTRNVASILDKGIGGVPLNVFFIALFLVIALIVIFLYNRATHEIKQRKIAEVGLRSSEEKYRLLFEESEDPMWVFYNNMFMLANEAAADTLGYSSAEELEEIHPSKISPSFQPDGEPSFDKANRMIRTAYELGYYRFEWEHLRKNGEIIPVEISLTRIPFQDHDALYCVWRDITERKQAETLLKEREVLYRSLIETTDTGYLILDASSRVLDANDEYIRISGHQRLDDILKRSVIEWTAEYDLERQEYEIKKCLELGFVRDLQVDYIHPNGTILPIDANAKMVKKGDERQILVLCRDITERRLQEEQILRQAHYDALTELPNRFLSMDRLSQMLNEANRNKERVAVLFLDLDDFKKINDSLGHDAGDKLLKEAALRLRDGIRGGDTVGRLGGDEFIVLLGGIDDAADVCSVAETLLSKFMDAFRIDGRELILTASIGISIYPDDGNTPSELLRNSDSAMYHSKEQGRNTYSYFTEEMNQGVSRRLLLEEQMHGALDRGEFRLLYQPKVDLNSGRVIGVEALLRWTNPALGEVSPLEFIHTAEQTGLIVPMGEYVLTEALAMVAKWRPYLGESFTMAVNLSPRQFRDPNLVQFIQGAIDKSGVSGKQLELEITEGLLMSGHAYIDDALSELSALEVSIAMDDFGTGYSSLSYLRSYPFNVLKIDREFVNDITVDPADRELVNAAIVMAHGLGLKVVAEGVETEAQRVLLSEQGCDYGQGYLFSKPIAPGEMTKVLVTGSCVLPLCVVNENPEPGRRGGNLNRIPIT